MTGVRSLLLACAVASALPHTAAAQESSLLVENVTLIDGTGRAAVTGASVLVVGDEALAVLSSG